MYQYREKKAVYTLRTLELLILLVFCCCFYLFIGAQGISESPAAGQKCTKLL